MVQPRGKFAAGAEAGRLLEIEENKHHQAIKGIGRRGVHIRTDCSELLPAVEAFES